MKIRALREFYGHPGEVRAGEEITVSKTTASELVANGLAEIVDDTDEEEDEDMAEKTEAGGEKAKSKPQNKAAPAPSNKGAAAPKAAD